MFITSFLQNFRLACNLNGGNILALPHWYQYLPGTTVPATMGKNTDGYPMVLTKPYCAPQINSISDIWLIVAAVVEILLYIGALAAVGMIVYGGIQFILAQGEPDKANQARKTITNALIGLVISIASASIVTFVAGSFK